ncbi:MAG: hypothetical protein DCC43_14915 [Candidatus Brocadia sp.]|uniref:Shikimate kinase n=1 Tax=Candidatus Brocadia fulgida TaxID=380242 RepID=A0A0M2UU35_9BACT|nr:MAG: hypothetical protein BROFUL_01952 [Candidatus Brocadia fulgida]MCC6325788.1 AAA family ATPase [Candidatus Brocadia sp.]RIJ90318.1 MAG: hypothetical protein DCC43_14915 [Candidatus Brocadia sp.]UJS21472.1 MAG: AAA family ATPase [Candidatus Brocadia sp.]
MKPTLITGISGVGKTSVVGELWCRGFQCIDMDEPGWSSMDAEGHLHWNMDCLEQAMTEAGTNRLFVSGCAEEQADLYDRFGSIILLSAPRDIMTERIRSRSNNAFGQTPAEMARILTDLEQIEPLLRERYTHEIKTTVPVKDVVDRILGLNCPTSSCTRRRASRA